MLAKVNLRAWGVFAAICLVAFSALPLSGDEKAPQTGLHGILPSELPEALSSKSLGKLSEDLKPWTTDVSAALKKLQEDESLTSAQQREQLELLEIKADELQEVIAKSDSASRSQLQEVQGSLDRYASIGVVILNTLDYDPSQAESPFEVAKKQLIEATETLNKYLKNIKNGDGWITYFQTDEIVDLAKSSSETSALLLSTLQQRFTDAKASDDKSQSEFLARKQFNAFGDSLAAFLKAEKAPAAEAGDQSALRGHLASMLSAIRASEETTGQAAAAEIRTHFDAAIEAAPDKGGMLTQVMREHYFNYNLRVIASEDLLNRLVTQERNEEGKVEDFILGAQVDGTQKTKATVGLDLKESSDRIKFHITLNGTSQTDTRGVTRQATVFTEGRHKFNASKEITFDGDKFKTEEAEIEVDANNTTVGAQSASGNSTGLVARIAMRAAKRKKAQSEAIAEQKMRERLKPEFNNEIDTMFVSLNEKLDGKLNGPLKKMRLFPSARSFATTEKSLVVKTRLMDEGEIAGSAPNVVSSDKGLVLQLHQSLLNNALDRMDLAGKSLDEAGLKAQLEKAISTFLGREYQFPAPQVAEGEDVKQDKTLFVFPKEDVLRIQLSAGELLLTLRTGLKPEKGEEIPTQRITVPIKFAVDGDSIVAERGKVSVAPVEKPSSRFKQIARAGVVRKKVEAALPKRTLDRHFSIDLEGKEPVKISLTQIDVSNQWLSLVVE
ncbi:MAG: hypothetical protein CMJ78_21705 [Planctomycetaceae bacterium]|nr:hypothetical protein [Planctomycetaceae bacterium]